MRKCLFSIIFSVLTSLRLNPTWTWDDQMFALNVSQINEFITRFNGEAGPHIAEMQKGKDCRTYPQGFSPEPLFDRSAKLDAKAIRDFLEKIDGKEQEDDFELL